MSNHAPPHVGTRVRRSRDGRMWISVDVEPTGISVFLTLIDLQQSLLMRVHTGNTMRFYSSGVQHPPEPDRGRLTDVLMRMLQLQPGWLSLRNPTPLLDASRYNIELTFEHGQAEGDSQQFTISWHLMPNDGAALPYRTFLPDIKIPRKSFPCDAFVR